MLFCFVFFFFFFHRERRSLRRGGVSETGGGRRVGEGRGGCGDGNEMRQFGGISSSSFLYVSVRLSVCFSLLLKHELHFVVGGEYRLQNLEKKALCCCCCYLGLGFFLLFKNVI